LRSDRIDAQEPSHRKTADQAERYLQSMRVHLLPVAPVCTANVSALKKWENSSLDWQDKAESSLLSDDVLVKQPADDASRVASSRSKQVSNAA